MVRTRTLSILLIATLLLSSCGKLPSLIPLGGGGTNVAANTQIGKENSQNVGVNTTIRPVIRPEGDVGEVNG